MLNAGTVPAMPAPLNGTFVPISAAHAVPSLEALMAAFLAGRSAQTLRAYAGDLAAFADFVGCGQQDAARLLLGSGHGAANLLAMDYRAALLGRKLAPATINRRLAALRALVKMANRLGLVAWALEVDGVKSQAYRETRGPGQTGAAALLQACAKETPEKAARDRALIVLMYACALRRSEVVGLDLADLVEDGAAVWIMGKGRTERERVTLPPAVRDALAAWLRFRGNEAGPLFTALDRAAKGERLTGNGLYKVVRTLGTEAGLGHVRPHGLRHAGITSALDLGADVRTVQRFSRHRDIRTLAKYDDNRADLGGQVAALVAGTLGGI